MVEVGAEIQWSAKVHCGCVRVAADDDNTATSSIASHVQLYPRSIHGGICITNNKVHPHTANSSCRRCERNDAAMSCFEADLPLPPLHPLEPLPGLCGLCPVSHVCLSLWMSLRCFLFFQRNAAMTCPSLSLG